MTILLLILLVVYIVVVSIPVSFKLVALTFMRNGADLMSNSHQRWSALERS